MIDAALIHAIMPGVGKRAELYAPLLEGAAKKFDIGTPMRLSAWLAQLAHESGQLVYTRELASGAVYEGRKDLGNDLPGDGVRYKGRGLIQITGRSNYQRASSACGFNYVTNPELMEQPEHACLVSGWFWSWKGLNALADAGDFLRITRIINGGTNGLADRETFYARAKQALGIDDGAV